MDVKGAYLNGKLKEKVYMRQPDGYNDRTGRVCLLLKTLYGLKQAGHVWNKEFDDQLKELGFKSLLSDPCAYIQQNGNDIEIITDWVDDLLLFASSHILMEKMKHDLRSKWEMTDLGEPTKIVGIEITLKPAVITLTQTQYIEGILKRERMDTANPVSTPMDPNERLEPNPDGGEGNRSNSYARLLRELQFLANATRPDIAYAVNRLAAYTANPSLQHTGALKQILRYLSGTRSYSITYMTPPGPSENKNIFFGYANATYANTDNYKSTSGHIFIVNRGMIT